MIKRMSDEEWALTNNANNVYRAQDMYNEAKRAREAEARLEKEKTALIVCAKELLDHLEFNCLDPSCGPEGWTSLTIKAIEKYELSSREERGVVLADTKDHEVRG